MPKSLSYLVLSDLALGADRGILAMEHKHQHFRKIDFLRGIAILTVFQAHFIWTYFPDYTGVVAPDAGHPATKVLLLNFLPRTIGWGGVTIFLLISGFLLHLGYLRDRERFTLRRFYSRRFWRVYPPYLLVLLVFSLFLERDLFASRSGWLAFGLHVLSLHNLFNRTYFSVNPTFWCLAAEVQLYVLYAVFLYGRKRWGVKAMLGFTFLLSVAWQAAGARLGGPGLSPAWTNSAISLWFVWAAGAFLAEAYDEGKHWWAVLSRRHRWMALAAGVLACCVAPLNALLQYAAALIGLVLMDAFLHAKGATLRSGPARLVVGIGLCSFSVFLIHQPLLGLFVNFLNSHSPHYLRYGNGVLATLLIFCLSWAMYQVVELPSIRMGNRLRKGRKTALTV